VSRRRRRSGQNRSLGRLPLVVLLVLAGGLGFAVSSAYTAGNSVPSTNIGQYTHTIDATALEPAACSSVLPSALTTIVTVATGGSYQPAGSMSNTLLLASSGAETIKTSAGSNNCVITGAGSDSINLKAVTNQVCIASAAALSSEKGCTTTVQRP